MSIFRKSTSKEMPKDNNSNAKAHCTCNVQGNVQGGRNF